MEYHRRVSVQILIFLLIVCQTTWSQNGCSFTQYVHPGAQYRINNPKFPYPYGPGTNCVWFLSTMKGHHVKVGCQRVEMPSNGPTCVDVLAVSTTSDMRDATAYCTPFTVQGPTVTMQLFTQTWSWGGIFACDITTEKTPTGGSNQTENCSCGWSFTSRIVGGTTAGVNEFPSMALVINAITRSQWCGATIISQRTALTAAHCFERNRNPNNFGLLIGEHDLRTREETNATKLLKVSRIIVHENFTSNGARNDIALMVTIENIVYTARVGPACLPFNVQKDDFMRQYVTVTGWGTIEFGGPLPLILQKVRLQVIPDSRCEKSYKIYNSEQQLCTYFPGKDACQFDSGGPLYYYNYLTNRYTVVGVVSIGIQCALEEPAVNVNVNHYLPWIKQKLPNEQFCSG